MCPKFLDAWMNRMIELHEEVYMDDATSCTINTAVMKLLGYAQGPIYRMFTRYSPEHCGVTEDEMKNTPPTLLSSIEDELNRLHHIALIAAENAVNNKKPDEKIQKKVDKIKKIRKTMKRAYKYKIAITEEIEKGSDSILKIDANKTEETGVTYITLSSFERWRAVSLKNDRNEEQSTLTAAARRREEKDYDGYEDIEEEIMEKAHRSDLITLYIAFTILRERSPDSRVKPLPVNNIANRIAEKFSALFDETSSDLKFGQGTSSITKKFKRGEKFFLALKEQAKTRK